MWQITIMNSIRSLIEKAGGAAKLAKAFGITRQAVEQWRVVPPERVLKVEELTGVSRYEIRPDIYGEASAKRERRAV
jgi:DNA-binding transcriptional regulator YdaS (Cro superfamily)